MATSGTISTTVIDVQTFIDHAVRRCGVLVTSLTAEQQLAAQENLFFILSDLANRGISLWCIQKYIVGLALNQVAFNLPLGTLDLIRANYRIAQNFLATPAFVSPNIWSVDTGTGTTNTVTTIGILSPTAQTLTLAVEYSQDGTTWTTLTTAPAFTTVAGLTSWIDLDPTATARAWRVRETVQANLTVTSVQFGNTTREIPMYKMNRNDYENLPQKNFAGRPLQLWYDRQFAQPRIWLWPVPNDATAQVIVWVQRHIQDVGTYSNTLEVPQHWYEAIVFLLSVRTALELPPDKIPPGRLEYLEMKSKEALLQAEDGETDGTPIRVQFSTAYTA